MIAALELVYEREYYYYRRSVGLTGIQRARKEKGFLSIEALRKQSFYNLMWRIKTFFSSKGKDN